MAVTGAPISELSTKDQDLRYALAFPQLSDAQLKQLVSFGKLKQFPQGEHLWEAGQANLCLYVVLDGEMEILDGRTGQHITSHVRGAFSGDVDVLSGRSVVVSARAKTDLEVAEIPGDCVRSIVGEHPDLGDVILRAFLARRQLLQESGEFGALIVGSRFDPATLRIREFLWRNRYPYDWADIESNRDTDTILREFQVAEEDTPIVVLPTGNMLRVPTNAELADGLGIRRPLDTSLVDLVVIGAGPAGLAAGVYGASEGLHTLVIDGNGPGGQAGMSSRIENYMGFPNGLSGQDLADRAVAQAERFGAQMVIPGIVTDITCNKFGGHFVKFEDGSEIEAQCVILATGASYRKLDIVGQEGFEGRGIYYAATNVERILCREEGVAVVGAGNSAGQAAVFMAEHSRHVTLVVRGDDLRKSMSSYLAARIEQSDKITVRHNSEVCELKGKDHLEAIGIVNRKSGEKSTELVSGVFVMIGAVPHTKWLPPAISLDEKGFVMTGQQLVQEGKWSKQRPPFFLETSCPGVFAAGDARSDSVKRVASAVGEGSMAVAMVHQFLAM